MASNGSQPPGARGRRACRRRVRPALRRTSAAAAAYGGPAIRLRRRRRPRPPGGTPPRHPAAVRPAPVRAAPAAPPPAPVDAPARAARRKRRTGLVVGLITVLLLALAVGGVVVVRPGPVAGWLGETPRRPASPTQPPEPSPAPVLAAVAADAPMPTADGLAAALDTLVAGRGLGGRRQPSRCSTSPPARCSSTAAPTRATVPASTMKLVTAATVLATRGPAYRIPTRVVAGAEPRRGRAGRRRRPDAVASAPSGYYPGAARLDELAAR